MIDKDKNRKVHADVMLGTVVFLIISVVLMGFVGKVTSEFNMALGAILAYAGNHTYQNYRTSPTDG